jgi:hypothetical protein
VALAILIRLYAAYESLEEDVIADRVAAAVPPEAPDDGRGR